MSASFDSNAIRLGAESILGAIGQWSHHAASRELRYRVDSSNWTSFDADGCTGICHSSPSTGLREDGNADAAQAVNTVLSPDGKTLLVLTSGWNNGNRSPDSKSIT